MERKEKNKGIFCGRRSLKANKQEHREKPRESSVEMPEGQGFFWAEGQGKRTEQRK